MNTTKRKKGRSTLGVVGHVGWFIIALGLEGLRLLKKNIELKGSQGEKKRMSLRDFKKAFCESKYRGTIIQEKYGPYKDQMIISFHNGYGISIIDISKACSCIPLEKDMIPIKFLDEFCMKWATVGDPITDPEIEDFLKMIEIWSTKETECK